MIRYSDFLNGILFVDCFLNWLPMFLLIPLIISRHQNVKWWCFRLALLFMLFTIQTAAFITIHRFFRVIYGILGTISLFACSISTFLMNSNPGIICSFLQVGLVLRRWDRLFYCRLRSEEHTSELQSRFDLVCR